MPLKLIFCLVFAVWSFKICTPYVCTAYFSVQLYTYRRYNNCNCTVRWFCEKSGLAVDEDFRLLVLNVHKIYLLHCCIYYYNMFHRRGTGNVLILGHPVVTICTTYFNIRNSAFCLHSVYVFCMMITINSDYFPIQY